MPSRVERISFDARLSSVEHHHFCLGGKWFLFDVGALTVLDSTPLDGVILEAASDPADRREILRRATLEGAAPREISKRITTLIKHRFLLSTQDRVRVAKLGK